MNYPLKKEIKWFTDLCERLNIDLFVYPTCSKCHKTIYGTFTIDKNGKDLCFTCNKE